MKGEQQETDRYFRDISRYPVLSREDEHKLACKARDGDSLAREKLIVSNLRFVVQVAHSLKGYLKHCKISMLDLIQEGNIGLMKAVTKFDPERGNRLISYAYWDIKVGMQKLIINNFSQVKLGTTNSQRLLFFKLGALTEIAYTQDPERKQYLREQLAKKVKVTLADILSMEERLSWKDKSLSDSLTGDTDNPTTLVDMLSERDPWTDTLSYVLDCNDAQEYLRHAMKKLSDREQIIIKKRWLTPLGMTLVELGNELGITRERVRQIESVAINKIRLALNRQGIVKSELGQ